MLTASYALEQLYVDQEHDWVVDAIPAVLAWVPGEREGDAQPFVFEVAYTVAATRRPRAVRLALRWDVDTLVTRDPELGARVTRYREGRTVHREHLAETAAYGLAFVAISVFLPGRRIVGMQRNVAPDILLDRTPGALRGVEVAGRATGGGAALRAAREGTSEIPGKAAQLLGMSDVAEAHLSLWCRWPRLAEMFRVKP